jgi:uncharacterized protein (TIGR03437 family)
LRSITEGAGFRTFGSANALATIFGLDFQVGGRKRSVGIGDFVNGRFPPELGCVAVEVAGQRAPMVYVQTDQINFQIPTGTPSGPVQVRVLLNPGRQNQLVSDVGTFEIRSHAPALFTFNSNGRNAAALIAGSDIPVVLDPAISTRGRAARPGEKIELDASGLGLSVDPVFQAGERAPLAAVNLRDRVTATIGGVDAVVEYAGLAPTYISGLYQVNLVVPAALADGDHPVVLRIGGVESQAGVILPIRR